MGPTMPMGDTPQISSQPFDLFKPYDTNPYVMGNAPQISSAFGSYHPQGAGPPIAMGLATQPGHHLGGYQSLSQGQQYVEEPSSYITGGS